LNYTPILVTLDTVWARGLLPRDAIWVMPFVLLLNLLSAVIMYEVVKKRMYRQLLVLFVPAELEVKYLQEFGGVTLFLGFAKLCMCF
jgi:hypothetical protein